MTPDQRLVAVPDTDGELLALLGVLEEILTSLGPFEDEAEDWYPPASPLGHGRALEALRRVISELADAERSPAPQPLAPDGRFELVPVRFLTLDGPDLAVMAQAIAALGQATLPGADELVADVLAEHAAAWRQRPAEVVVGAARTHGLLDLAADVDTVLLAGRLAGRRPSSSRRRSSPPTSGSPSACSGSSTLVTLSPASCIAGKRTPATPA